MLNFDILDNCLGLDFLPHFVHDFSRKLFLMLFSITGTVTQIAKALINDHLRVSKVS